MDEVTLLPIRAWESFYVIVGSSAAALTGLQFVVITLGTEARTLRAGTVNAFGTPTIVHFCQVLLVSAILSAPWQTIESPGIALSLCGAAGIGYTLIVAWRTWRQTGYKPELEDWLFHAAFPLIAYIALLIAAMLLEQDPVVWLFAIGAIALTLLFIGIHNAWDAVTYIAAQRAERAKEP